MGRGREGDKREETENGREGLKKDLWERLRSLQKERRNGGFN